MTVLHTVGSSERLHATCVAMGDRGVLLSGRSGSGKSDLALRLIDRGARLVSDDATLVTRRNGVLSASAPTLGAGLMEVRGLGIVETDVVDAATVALIVDLDDIGERMPLNGECRYIAGVALPVLHLDSTAPSAPIKVEWALRQLAAS